MGNVLEIIMLVNMLVALLAVPALLVCSVLEDNRVVAFSATEGIIAGLLIFCGLQVVVGLVGGFGYLTYQVAAALIAAL